MTYVRGVSLWHGVLSWWQGEARTLCGRRFPANAVITDHVNALFLCHTCEGIMARSRSVVGA